VSTGVYTLDDIGDRIGLGGGLDALTRSFASEVGAATALLALWDEHDGAARIWAPYGLKPGVEEARVRRGEGTAGEILNGARSTVYPLHPERGDPIAHAHGGHQIATVLGTPLLTPGDTVGALCAGFSRPPLVDSEGLVWAADSYAAVVSLCMQGSGFLGALVGEARRDGLTGCLNYGALYQVIAREINRCERHDRQLSCCFLDLDGFKRINDTRGHIHGNLVLAAVGAALSAGVRGSDIVARYGGDEFVVVLPETGLADAQVLARRLCDEVCRAAITAAGEPITASVGVAQWAPGGSVKELLERADQSLRIAKEAGGGEVAASDGGRPPSPSLPAGQSPPLSAAAEGDKPNLLLAIRRLMASERSG
jgi:diguanylate cyclase (GGDEF)-like protein